MSNINGVRGGGSSGRIGSSKKAQTTQSSKKTGASHSGELDQLNLSAGAVLLSDLQQALADVPEVDVIKVEQIRQAIKEGKLPLDRDRLASKMLELQSELKDI